MGYSLNPVPFWTDTIRVASCSTVCNEADLRIKTLRDLGQERLNRASLYQRDDNGDYVLNMADGTFIVFTAEEDDPVDPNGWELARIPRNF